MTYSGGLTAALMKPYYLEIGGSRDGSPGTSMKYSEENSKLFLDPYRIQGKGNLLKGVGETKIIPGIHGQIGVHLDWGAFDEFLKAIEVGIMLDVFPKKLPIMITEENRHIYEPLCIFAAWKENLNGY